MSTAYIISRGYNSKHNFNNDSVVKKYNQSLIEIYQEITLNTDIIFKEIEKEREGKIEIKKEELSSYFASYHFDPEENDLTFKLSKDDKGAFIVLQCASGGGCGRNYKEIVRRAVSRIFILEMNKRGFEVNYYVQ